MPSDLIQIRKIDLRKFLFMKNALVLFTVLFFCLCSHGQTSVFGTVIDKASRQPIEYASVLLIHLPDSSTVKGTATDKKGRFRMTSIKPGQYVLQCSFIGFDQIETKVFTIEASQTKYDLNTIELNNANKNLTDVTVVGRRPTLNTSIDRKVYNVEQDIMSRSGSASDILKNIPSVEWMLMGM